MQGKIRYANLWPRFLALLLDLLLFCLFFFPATRLIKGTWLLSATNHRWDSGLFITDPLCIVFLVIMFLYFVFLEGISGITLGKWVVGIKVMKPDEGIPGIRKSFVRNILRIIDGLPALNILGIILILKSKEKARFGDRIAETRVVHSRNY